MGSSGQYWTHEFLEHSNFKQDFINSSFKYKAPDKGRTPKAIVLINTTDKS